METKGDRTATIAVVAAVIALLLGICLGAIAGGAGGYLLGKSASPRQAPIIQTEPVVPELPELPAMPGLNLVAGAYVNDVVNGAPAAAAGLQAGDVITRVDDTPIDINHRLSDVLNQYRPGDRVMLSYLREGNSRSVGVRLGEHPDDPARPYLGIYYQEPMWRRGLQPGD